MAERRVRRLEANRLALLGRKARLEAQRDKAGDFVMLVGSTEAALNAEQISTR
jgi:hypothetical protein